MVSENGNPGSNHPLTSVRRLHKEEILFKEGDQSDSLYLTQSGQISIRRMRGLQMIEIARLHEGEVLGELSFFDRAPRSATAVATSRLQCRSLFRARFAARLVSR